MRPSFAGAGDPGHGGPHPGAEPRSCWPGCASEGGGDFAAEFALPLVFGVSHAADGRAGVGRAVLAGAPAALDGPHGRPVRHPRGRRPAPTTRPRSTSPRSCSRRREEIAAGAEADTPDVISQILLAGAKRALLDEAEQVGLAHLVLSASTDAPAALLTNCIAVLDKYPPCRATCATTPRWSRTSSRRRCATTARRRTCAGRPPPRSPSPGSPSPPNSRVMVLMGSANRDERVYPDPDTFDLFRDLHRRQQDPHLRRGHPLLHGRPAGPADRPGRGRGTRRRPATAPRSASSAPPSAGPSRWCAASPGCRSRSSRREQDAVDRATARGVDRARGDGAAPQHPAHPGHPRVRGRRPGRRQGRRRRRCRRADPARGRRAAAAAVGARRARRPDPRQRRDPAVLAVRRPRRPHHVGGSASCATRTAAAARSTSTTSCRPATSSGSAGPATTSRSSPRPRYLFIAGGIGITPILAMIRSAEAAGADWQLVYGGRQRASMAFLDELAAYGDRVTVWPQDETRVPRPRRPARPAAAGHQGLLLRPRAAAQRRRAALRAPGPRAPCTSSGSSPSRSPSPCCTRPSRSTSPRASSR